MKTNSYETHTFSLVICRNFDGKWLCVKEVRNLGWWVAGGHVDEGEDVYTAACRETEEEAGIKIDIKGILRVEHTPNKKYARMRVIFFAFPIDKNQKVKKIADEESEEADWFNLKEIENLKNCDPGWRGSELYDWPKYIENGGVIIPIDYITFEDKDNSLVTINKFINFYKIPNLLEADNKLREINEDETKKLFVDAINNSDLPTIKKYLINNFNPNIVINKKLWSPLHQACKNGTLELVNILLMYDANIDAVTHRNRNCLNFAVQQKDIKLLNSLFLVINQLDKESQQKILNRQDLDEGDTSLHTVSKMILNGSIDHVEIYKTLINFGADDKIKNFAGKTCHDIHLKK